MNDFDTDRCIEFHNIIIFYRMQNKLIILLKCKKEVILTIGTEMVKIEFAH
jgi:hypothetical protein